METPERSAAQDQRLGAGAVQGAAEAAKSAEGESQAPSAAQIYDYERIIDLISRIRECADVVERELPARTPESNQRARNYAAQVEVDVRELQQELLERHLAILKEARQRV